MRDYRLLIVDDDAVDRRLYGKLLAQLGPDTCHVQQAADGAAGLATLRTEKFDCVLLDFRLPDMTGLEFLAAAVVDGELPCAVVLITGQGNEAIAVQAMKRGVRDYLVKDQVNATSLWRTMTQAVTQTELQQRLACSLRDLTAANLALEQEAAIRKAAEAEMRTAKEAAEHANQAKTRFVAMVTHELRTPLNGILGYAQLLRIEPGLSPRQDAHVGAMMQAGRHLLEMIERVLDFASIESGRMELHPVEVSVRDLTEGCVAFISPMATKRALSLRVVNAHDAPRQIVTDPSRLRQVLLNLLGNAVKYTDAGSVELRLLTGAVPNGLRIEVADTGRGIDEASRDRLFQDFERLEAATSVEGTGLGLAIAARIIRLMGGTINHASNPGGGSLFWFELPPGELALPAPPEPAEAASSSSRRHVLLVDDIKINRDIIGAFLDAAGHEAVMAEGGQEAIQLATERQFDVILMDVRMPKIDGLEATRRIRTLPGAQGQVPILALTAYTFPDQVAQCRDAGMDGHLPKPVDYQTLINGIDDVIARVLASKMKGDLEDVGIGGSAASSDQDGDQGPIASGVWPARAGSGAGLSID
ncbi:hybrid sensor histidine kinase/response regulator [Acidisphaera sp. S103]|uniref:hybrid sensor histidine kinase/response regulator n=1 Tax=Acidisphaera sp. S103 TaxID=1747223 RepID=UPI00131C7EEB|nr:hybrid sensor histidine kinase/response regulator [Acidisphaera sp. S103]